LPSYFEYKNFLKFRTTTSANESLLKYKSRNKTN